MLALAEEQNLQFSIWEEVCS